MSALGSAAKGSPSANKSGTSGSSGSSGSGGGSADDGDDSDEEEEASPGSSSTTAREPVRGDVIINELMASNETTIMDPQAEFDDWIELHNVTGDQVDLSGWYLSDNPDNPRKWELPAGTVIGGNDYLIIWADEDGSASVGLHASFKLSSDGEFLSLASPDASDNHIMDQIDFGPQQQDVSFGRVSSEGSVYESLTPSPGEPNL